MSMESAKAFVKRMKIDETFAKEVEECKDAEMRMSYVKKAGFDFTEEEIKFQLFELNDDGLKGVACGGIAYDCFVKHLPTCV